MAYTKIYTGSPIIAKAVAARLDEANIAYIEKDVTPGNAMTGDINGGIFEVHVEEADKVRAEALISGL